MFAEKQDQLKEISNTMTKFWSIEQISQCEDLYSVKNKSLLENIRKTFKKCSDVNRYEIGVPWKENRILLRNNYDQAFKRLINTEQQLMKKPQIKKLYSDTLTKYLEKGYIKEINTETREDNTWFLPHFPVIRMQKETSKVRIIFDASASYQGISLNDTIDQGPNL